MSTPAMPSAPASDSELIERLTKSFILFKAMANNYTDKHILDKLDFEAFRAAEKAMREAAEVLARLSRAEAPADELCDDCPPVGYETDRTRCLPCPRRNPVPSDLTELVCSARVVAFESQSSEALSRLDKASEAFADRIPWDDEPSIDRAAPAAGVVLEAVQADKFAQQAADAIGVTPHSDMRPFVEQAVKYALVSSAAEIAELRRERDDARQLQKAAHEAYDTEFHSRRAAEAALSAAAAKERSLRDLLASENEATAEYLRYCASHYPEASDGRNTFVMAASWVEARRATLTDTAGER